MIGHTLFIVVCLFVAPNLCVCTSVIYYKYNTCCMTRSGETKRTRKSQAAVTHTSRSIDVGKPCRGSATGTRGPTQSLPLLLLVAVHPRLVLLLGTEPSPRSSRRTPVPRYKLRPAHRGAFFWDASPKGTTPKFFRILRTNSHSADIQALCSSWRARPCVAGHWKI